MAQPPYTQLPTDAKRPLAPGYAPPGGPSGGMVAPPPAGMAPPAISTVEAGYGEDVFSGGPPSGGVAAPSGGAGVASEGDDYVVDNPNAPELAPSAPPVEQMDVFDNYTQFTAQHGYIPPPPSYEETMSASHTERSAATNLPGITEEDAREALLEYVANKCCYSKGLAKKLEFVAIETSSVHTYFLITMSEKRSVNWHYEKYHGQPIDGTYNGMPPAPWDIPVPRPADFQENQKFVEVPHTASLKPCHDCIGLGHRRCTRCRGRGNTICGQCNGRGHARHHEEGRVVQRPCSRCHGSRRHRCLRCTGRGHVVCTTCGGTRQLKFYLQLKVNWKVYRRNHVVQTCDIPNRLVAECQGNVIAFQEKHERVVPVNHFPVAEINQASQRLIQEALHMCNQERILLQRHWVTVIPATRATYTHKGKTDFFYVYGTNNSVYAPAYKSRCACTIL